MQKAKTRTSLAVLAWIAGLLWAILILSFSAEPADISSEKSMAITRRIETAVRYIEGRLGIEIVDKSALHHYVRKTAHLTSYALFGLLLATAFLASGFKGNRAPVAAWLLAGSFSVLDEYYQGFVPGRGPQVSDVLLDNVGIFWGLILFYSLRQARRARTLRGPE